mgnify:FL=1|tara:strand:- start:697 stop:810 length:114 start_codon:yes stop_codon:yes gene_type:complete
MTLDEKYEVRLKQLEEGAKEIYEGEKGNIEVILRLGE